MNFLSFSGLVVGCVGVGCLVYVLRGPALMQVKVLWSLFNLTLTLWGGCLYLAFSVMDPQMAVFWLRMLNLTAMVIPLFFLHASFFLSKENRPHKDFLILNYCLSVAYLHFVIVSPYSFIRQALPGLDPAPLCSPGRAYAAFPLLFTCQFLAAAWLLYSRSRQSTGAVKAQARHILAGLVLAYAGAGLTFFAIIGIKFDFYPVVLMALSAVIISCAATRHRLMDVRVLLTSIGLFSAVYFPAIGLPFYIFYKGYAFAAMVMMTLCATVAPFIYMRLIAKVEASMQGEQRLYRDILVRVSQGFSRLRSLEDIARFTVQMVPKVMRLRGAAFYLYQDQKLYLKDSSGSEIYPVEIVADDTSMMRFASAGAFLTDEWCQESGPGNNTAVGMNVSPAAAVLPVMRDGHRLGVILLGNRIDGGTFVERDLTVFSVIADHAALAMENSLYWIDAVKRLEEGGQRARMASLDAMASCIAHEIDNPNAVILGQAELVEEAVDAHGVEMTEGVRREIKSSLAYIIEASNRVADMVRTILEYSRMGHGSLRPVRIEPAVDAFEILIKPQMKKQGVVLVKDIAPDLPVIFGDKVQLEEILMNFAVNAIFAVREKTAGKRLTLKIFLKNPDTVCLQFADNGEGIPARLLKDVFLPSVTTKGSSQGTGLGLYRVRKIVDLFNGVVWAESAGEGCGACFVVELPVYRGDVAEFKNNLSRKVYS